VTKYSDAHALSLYDTPEQSPGYLLWRVSLLWRNSIESVLKPLELTHPQFVVLATTGWLTSKNNKISQIDIGRAAGLDPNTTSQVLRGLEEKGLIKRIRSIDERSKNPQLTNIGITILTKAMQIVENTDMQFFKKLSDSENLILINLFNKLIS
jgi:DNA-binding MarR family transcriptional regulator